MDHFFRTKAQILLTLSVKSWTEKTRNNIYEITHHVTLVA